MGRDGIVSCDGVWLETCSLRMASKITPSETCMLRSRNFNAGVQADTVGLVDVKRFRCQRQLSVAHCSTFVAPQSISHAEWLISTRALEKMLLHGVCRCD